MKSVLKWYAYNTFIGNSKALSLLISRLGTVPAANLVRRLQWRLVRNSPFKAMNALQQPTKNERMSQRQIAPVIVLYQLLREDGKSESDTLSLLAELVQEVGIGFMRLSIPMANKNKFQKMTHNNKLLFLSRIKELFFNSEGVMSLDGNKGYHFDVHRCHFAHYSKVLGLPQLGPLFCQADKPYFERHQPDMVFFRSRTLAEDQQPCDFYFQWR